MFISNQNYYANNTAKRINLFKNMAILNYIIKVFLITWGKDTKYELRGSYGVSTW